ncbi:MULTISPECIES: CobW family GTP-binding protein [unclassified Paenibacillus]|uniref:CobW family GTP-binding protein n=1 Tax=unclassified Paenibacillus TaxID=185978 RepID=UPI00104D9BE4|nr:MULTISPECIES: CobW family GTP-binding protein [unclassified Paenibacillus]NIK72403.1 G3E family GTPase [Paenibacillus sp. BK720]TCM87956.1 G3E family GTPase [Paenibacillus sp. BK033]
MNTNIIPIYLLSGFLGSGKTTLLTGLLDHWQAQGLKAAVIMNELGDINLDGQMVGDKVPMSEMLSGCICCTIRSDLSLEIKALIDTHQPDVIVIESTGAANPMEIMDGVTEAALYCRIELQSVITVVDGPELLQRSRSGKGKTFKLMRDQIRCATRLLLNKADKLAPDELVEAQQLVREMNAVAPVLTTVRCRVEDWTFIERQAGEAPRLSGANREEAASEHGHHEGHHHHHTHEHVMVMTHYMNGAVDSEAFEAFLKQLPDQVYRAKGIVSFSDTASRFLFQYAYRETDFIRITPQGEVNDVAVFIGEHFSKDALLEELRKLEREGEPSNSTE